MTERFDNSIKNNNYLMIFDLEEIAQEHDAEYHFAEKGKSKKSYSTLLEMKTRFLEFAENPEKIKNRFGKEIENLKMEGKKMTDGAFVTSSNSLRGFINSFKSPRCTPSENAFYSIRASAIKMIQDEHQRNIDIALGYVKRK